MGDYANTLLLAWPYPGERALPDAIRDLLEMDFWLPDLDHPVDGLGDDEAAVLAGDDDSGPILAISDTQANDGTERFRELIAALTEVGMSVYAANQAGDNYPAWNVYYLANANHVQQHRYFVDGEIVVNASDLAAPGELFSNLSDSDLASRTREMLDHPPGLPAAVLAHAWARGPRRPTTDQRPGGPHAIDLPNPHDPEGPWVNYGTYDTHEAALRAAQHHFAADDVGRVGLVSRLPDDGSDADDIDTGTA